MDQDFLDFQARMRQALAAEFGIENTAAFWGNQSARIISISQAPSPSAIKRQKPFSDKSGEKLREKWYQVPDEVFYNPDNFYFTAVGMYYPGKGKNGDLKPSSAIAQKWLRQELEFLDPKLFLLIGTVAAKFFFPKQDFTDLVFQNQVLNGRPALVLPHPSPLNIKWFKDHPEFEAERLLEVRKTIQGVLALDFLSDTVL